MNLNGLFAYLNNKYPEHDFAWRQHGKTWVGFCPAHDDKRTPNFIIMPNEENDNDYHAFCFACGHYEPVGEQTPIMRDLATMKVYLKERLNDKKSIYSKYLVGRISELDDDDKEVSDELKEELLGLDIFAYDHTILDKLTDETLKTKIQEIPALNNKYQSFLVFAYRNVKNQVVSLKFRNIYITKGDPKWSQYGIKTIKLTNESGYFNVQALYSKYPVLLIVEGEFDAITTQLVAGEQYPAVAVSGTSGFTAENLKNVLKIASSKDKAVFLVPDWDEAGQTALNNFIQRVDKKFLEHKKIFTFSSYYNTAKKEKIKDMDELLRGRLENAEGIMEGLVEHAKPLMLYKEFAEKQEKKAKEQEKQEILGNYNDGFVRLLNKDDKNKIENIVKFGTIDLPLMDNFILEPYVPRHSIILFDGLGELGKSLLAMQMALCISANKQFLSFKTKKPQKTLYLSAEEDEYNFNDRLKKLKKGLKIKNTDLNKNFAWLSIYSQNFQCSTYRLLQTNRKEIAKTEFYDYLINIITQFNPSLIILDSLINFYGLNENDSEHASAFLETLKIVSKNYDCSFLLLHHQNKNAMMQGGEKIFRGSTVFREQSRARITFSKVNNCDNVKKLELEKLNYFSPLRRDVYLSLATVDENGEPILCFHETDKPVEKETEKKINKGKGGTPHDEA